MRLATFLIVVTFVVSANAQMASYGYEDVQVAKSKFAVAEEFDASHKDAPIGETLAAVGRSFIGVDYQAHTLDAPGPEMLVAYLGGLDCMTFVEASLCLTRVSRKGDPTFDDYLAELRLVRYRDGAIDGYPSRLHYFCDWIRDNESKGIVEDVTEKIGGVPYEPNVGIMTAKPDRYEKLKNNPEFLERMREIEATVNAREYHYIPQDKIAEAEPNIMEGDILAMATSIEGVGVGHTGVAVRGDDGRIHFLHAPQTGTKIQITEKPLADYVASVETHVGVIVVRPLPVE
ncbi:MAG: DUF1460 domain-containing protein [Ignavibacteriales bacterium]|nr:DUF1460 domain-containing protein [Ignavibacteriales bacterium]